MSKQNKDVNASRNINLLCGEKVTYKECFGDQVLFFVGMAPQLEFNNDCVVTHKGNCCPVRYSGLERIDT